MSLSSFWKNSAANKILLIVIFLWIVLAVVFGIYDLEISNALYNPSSGIAAFIQAFGEIPGALFGIFALFTFWPSAKFKNKKRKKLFFFFTIALSTFLFCYSANLIFSYFNPNFQFVSSAGGMMIFAFAMFVNENLDL